MIQKKVNNPLCFPMLVSERGDVKNEPGASEAIWEKYRLLPKEQQDILTSEELPAVIVTLQEKFHIASNSIGGFSLLIRKIFFGELSLEQAEAKIGSMFMTTAGGDPNQAKAITDFIRNEVMTIKPALKMEETSHEEEIVKPMTENLPLMQAITKYEKLSQQMITSERIKVKSQTESVRPSLVNWIKYYRDELGVGFHDSVQRGNFLFRSENCKRLFPEERERVNLILKSIEENYPLPVDTRKEEIVFPEFATLKPHTAMPTEKKVIPAPMPLHSSPAVPRPAAPSVEVRTAPAPTPGITKQQPASVNAVSTDGKRSAFDPFLGGSLGINKGDIRDSLLRPASDGSLTFSSNHVFPAEKEAITERPHETEIPVSPSPSQPAPKMPPAAAPAPAQPVVPKVPTPKPNPFHIRPVSQRGNEEREVFSA